MDESTPLPVQAARRLWQFVSHELAPGRDTKEIQTGLSNTCLMMDLFSFENGGLVVDERSVFAFVERVRFSDDAWERFQGYEALRSAFECVCRERMKGQGNLHCEDFDESDGPLVAWWTLVRAGEIESPAKPRGPDPRAKESRDALICHTLARLRTLEIKPTKNDAGLPGGGLAAHESPSSGCELVAPLFDMKPKTVIKVWEDRRMYGLE